MRTKTESIAGLLEAIERAKQQKDFNILKDLKELRGKFGKVQKRDYLALLDKLMEKIQHGRSGGDPRGAAEKMPGRRYGRNPAVDGAAERERQRRGGGEHR